MNINKDSIIDLSRNQYFKNKINKKTTFNKLDKNKNSNTFLEITQLNRKISNCIVDNMRETTEKTEKILNKITKKNSLNCKENGLGNNLKDKKSSTKPRIIPTINENNKNIIKNIDLECNKYYVRENRYKNHESSNISTLKTQNEKDYLNFKDSFELYNNDNLGIMQGGTNLIIEKEKIVIDKEINNIDDLLNIIRENELSLFKEYNINMKALHNIKDELELLNSMIGMHSLKTSILDQIIYFVQDLHINNGDSDFLHTCIYGPPGTGKTEVAKIMGKLYSKLGILKNNIFRKVTRSDLIAGYLGQTALKTKDAIESCLGGVMFIDEAYALGNPEKKDSFAKECIDTLCEALTDHKKDLMVIIAGYEEELKRCFFSFNPGLESRFNWRFKTDDYNAIELYEIFLKKIKDNEWKHDKSIQRKWFENHKEYFTFYGRDIETLFSKVKIAHSRRVFCKGPEHKKKIIQKDLEEGFKMFCQNENIKKRGEKKDNYYSMTMYC